ncbi:hypothetical protein LINPERPRIM_LOCUS29337 [Linum perenne]
MAVILLCGSSTFENSLKVRVFYPILMAPLNCRQVNRLPNNNS